MLVTVAAFCAFTSGPPLASNQPQPFGSHCAAGVALSADGTVSATRCQSPGPSAVRYTSHASLFSYQHTAVSCHWRPVVSWPVRTAGWFFSASTSGASATV